MVRLRLYEDLIHTAQALSPVQSPALVHQAWEGLAAVTDASPEPGRRVHVPVLLDQVVGGLEPHPGGAYIDATVGLGGHATALLSAAGPDARLLGLDADPKALALAAGALQAFGDGVLLEEANFRHLTAVAEGLGFTQVDGVLLDLGVSSLQLGDPERGFSFRGAHDLDMRFSPDRKSVV